MNLSENFNHTLQFSIQKDISDDVLQKWNQFKILFESNLYKSELKSRKTQL